MTALLTVTRTLTWADGTTTVETSLHEWSGTAREACDQRWASLRNAGRRDAKQTSPTTITTRMEPDTWVETELLTFTPPVTRLAMTVLLSRIVFHPGDGWTRRLCEACRRALGCDCNTCREQFGSRR